MAMIDVPMFEWPPFGMHRVSTILSTSAISSATHKLAQIVHANKSGTINKIRFRSRPSPVTGGVRVSLQDLDASGNPDGVVNQFRTINVSASNTVFETGLITSDGTDTGGKRTVAKGDRFAIVFDYDSYTTQNITLTGLSMGASLTHPYSLYFNGTSWTKTSTLISLGVELDLIGWTWMLGAGPLISAAAALSINLNSSPDEQAMQFQVPCKMRATGCWIVIDGDGDFDIVLYGSDGNTVLTSASVDADMRINANVGNYYVMFDDDVDLNASTTYYLSVKPTTTTDVGVQYFQLPIASDLATTVAGGSVYSATRTNSGSWTEDKLAQMSIGLFVNGIDVSSGNSSSVSAWAH